MFKLIFYVPVENAESVKQACFEAGAGRIGEYEACSFETLGIGQFRALEQANPTLGKRGVLEKVDELKIEMVCEDEIIIQAVEAMIQAHPYEEPAYQIFQCLTLDDLT